jgi:hypothetical protein
MIKNQRLRVGLRVMRFNAIERAHDLLNIVLPIFLVSGILLGSVRLWFWLYGFDAVLACSR